MWLIFSSRALSLTISRNEDAERDCSTALQLKPGHVKALFRRAQARIELRKLQEARKGNEMRISQAVLLLLTVFRSYVSKTWKTRSRQNLPMTLSKPSSQD